MLRCWARSLLVLSLHSVIITGMPSMLKIQRATWPTTVAKWLIIAIWPNLALNLLAAPPRCLTLGQKQQQDLNHHPEIKIGEPIRELQQIVPENGSIKRFDSGLSEGAFGIFDAKGALLKVWKPYPEQKTQISAQEVIDSYQVAAELGFGARPREWLVYSYEAPSHSGQKKLITAGGVLMDVVNGELVNEWASIVPKMKPELHAELFRQVLMIAELHTDWLQNMKLNPRWKEGEVVGFELKTFDNYPLGTQSPLDPTDLWMLWTGVEPPKNVAPPVMTIVVLPEKVRKKLITVLEARGVLDFYHKRWQQ